MNYTGEIRARDPAELSNGHPVFGETDVLARLEIGVGLLISKEAALHFGIGAVVVRQRVAPVEAVGVDSPGPDFFRGQFVVAGKMSGAAVRMRIPETHEVF